MDERRMHSEQPELFTDGYSAMRELAEPGRLAEIDLLAQEFGFVETQGMQAISHAEQVFPAETLPTRVAEWQQHAEVLQKLGRGDWVTQQQEYVGYLLAYLSFMLRQQQYEFAQDQIISDLEDWYGQHEADDRLAAVLLKLKSVLAA